MKGWPAPRGFGVHEAALEDLERAVCRDRSHVILRVAPLPARARIVLELGERLRAGFRLVHLSGRDLAEAEPCPPILRGLDGEAGGDAKVRVLGLARELASRGGALVVLIEEADSLSGAALRRLGELATAARPGLCLVLLATAEEAGERDRATAMVTALGVGVQKLEATIRPAAAPARPATSREPRGPRREGTRHAPAANAIPLRREAPARATTATTRNAKAARLSRGSAVGRPGPRRHGRRAAVATLVATLAGAGAAFHAMSGIPAPYEIPPLSGMPAPHETRSLALFLADATAAAGARAVPGPQPAPRPTGRTAESAPEKAREALPASRAGSLSTREPEEAVHLEPERAAVSGRASEPEVRPASSGETEEPSPEPVRVSLNARPWARIAVDGRELGVTPLANLAIDPGPHRFRARLPDGRVIERTIHVDARNEHLTFP